MKIVLFGATGMVGQGVLRECLLDPEVDAVLSVVRRAGPVAAGAPAPASGVSTAKLRELVHADFHDFSSIAADLAGCDACLFSLGVSSFRMPEQAYRDITVGITLAAANTLVKANPAMVFLYVSGAGTDSTSKVMWARVKGQLENELLAMPFQGAYMFRPGGIQPLHGITSKTAVYRVMYVVLRPVFALLRGRFPKYLTTTEQIGRATLAVAKHGYPKKVLESEDINSV